MQKQIKAKAVSAKGKLFTLSTFTGVLTRKFAHIGLAPFERGQGYPL